MFKRLTLLVLVLQGCGVEFYDEQQEAQDKELPVQEFEAKSEPSLSREAKATTTIRGWVSPLDLTVDGESFGVGGSESFFTKTWERLRREADDAGLEAYDLKIIGKLGLTDFSSNMKVIGASTSFAFERNVTNGSFTVNLPPAYDGSPVSIRAIRRIEVKLIPREREKKAVSWCYNLISDQLLDPKESDAIVLNQFISTTTRYGCGSSGSIVLPSTVAQP